MRKKTALRIKRRVKNIFKKGRVTLSDAYAVISYWGWIKRTNSYNFYMKNVRPYINIKTAKKIVSDNARRCFV